MDCDSYVKVLAASTFPNNTQITKTRNLSLNFGYVILDVGQWSFFVSGRYRDLGAVDYRIENEYNELLR